jgi:hypothetical protein
MATGVLVLGIERATKLDRRPQARAPTVTHPTDPKRLRPRRSAYRRRPPTNRGHSLHERTVRPDNIRKRALRAASGPEIQPNDGHRQSRPATCTNGPFARTAPESATPDGLRPQKSSIPTTTDKAGEQSARKDRSSGQHRKAGPGQQRHRLVRRRVAGRWHRERVEVQDVLGLRPPESSLPRGTDTNRDCRWRLWTVRVLWTTPQGMSVADGTLVIGGRRPPNARLACDAKEKPPPGGSGFPHWTSADLAL